MARTNLKRCIYTGALTACRRPDGEPAISEAAIRAAFEGGVRHLGGLTLEQIEKAGFGAGEKDAPAPKAPPRRR